MYNYKYQDGGLIIILEVIVNICSKYDQIFLVENVMKLKIR